MSSQARLDAEIAHAKEVFANHLLALDRAEEGRWILKRPDASEFWVEIVALRGGRLLVHGDIEPAIFGNWRAPQPAQESTPSYNRGLVRWMGSQTRPNDSYFLEKLKIGMSSSDAPYEPDLEVLAEEIDDLIKEEEDPTLRDGLKEIRENLPYEESDIPEVQKAIYDLLEDAESVPRARFIRAHVVYAHAALQRLVAIFDEIYSS